VDEPIRKEEGNLRSPLEFSIQSGNQILKNPLANATGNALYASWKIQNEIIEAMHKISWTE